MPSGGRIPRRERAVVRFTMSTPSVASGHRALERRRALERATVQCGFSPRSLTRTTCLSLPCSPCARRYARRLAQWLALSAAERWRPSLDCLAALAGADAPAGAADALELGARLCARRRHTARLDRPRPSVRERGRPLARIVTRRHVLQFAATCCNALRRGATQHAAAPPPAGGGKANKGAAPALDLTGQDWTGLRLLRRTPVGRRRGGGSVQPRGRRRAVRGARARGEGAPEGPRQRSAEARTARSDRTLDSSPRGPKRRERPKELSLLLG